MKYFNKVEIIGFMEKDTHNKSFQCLQREKGALFHRSDIGFANSPVWIMTLKQMKICILKLRTYPVLNPSLSDIRACDVNPCLRFSQFHSRCFFLSLSVNLGYFPIKKQLFWQFSALSVTIRCHKITPKALTNKKSSN